MSAFFTVAFIHFLAMISPGPDFAFIAKQSIGSGRKTAVLGAAGIAAANLIHITYCMLGIGVLIANSILLFNIIKYIGAAYLLCIGIKALLHKEEQSNSQTATFTSHSAQSISTAKAIALGFLVNILNPKCTLFYLALFTQVINPQETSLLQMWLYGSYMSIISFVWFASLAAIITIPTIQELFASWKSSIDRVMGAVLIALGLKVALATNK